MIEKLSDEVIAKIAAGEVITSPDSLLKELLENSIDANSTEITIKFDSSLSKFEICDNGTGINETDFELLCAPHCTSKIKLESDLINVSTYGFRGEALSSISQFADVSVSTSNRKAIYKNSKLIGVVGSSVGKGSLFVVENAFQNTIRMSSFGKNEIKNVFELISLYSVYNYDVNFIVWFNDKLVEKFQFKNTQPKREMSVVEKKSNLLKFYFGIKNTLLFKFFDLNADEKSLMIFSDTSLHLNKFVFIVFVNNRLVENKFLKNEILKFYREILPKNKFPFFYLELNVVKNEIDVNIHPSKREVLVDENKIVGIMKEELRLSLESTKIIQIPVLKSVYSPVKIYTDPKMRSLDQVVDFTPKKKYELDSLNEIKSEIVVIDNAFFNNLVFVGVSGNVLFVQFGDTLLECDFQKLKRQFFRQNFIFEFGNFETVRVGKFELDFEVRKNVKLFLCDYFKIEIDGNSVVGVCKKFDCVLAMDDVVEIVRAINGMEFKDEKKVILDTVCVVAEKFVDLGDDRSIFQVIKSKMKATEEISAMFTVVTTLNDLYKQFERC